MPEEVYVFIRGGRRMWLWDDVERDAVEGDRVFVPLRPVARTGARVAMGLGLAASLASCGKIVTEASMSPRDDATAPCKKGLVALASGLQPTGVAVDATSVYWTNQGCPLKGGTCEGTLVKVPKCGGSPVTLASGLNGPNAVAVDDTSAYWANLGGSVMKVALSGGAPTVLAADAVTAFDIAVDGTSAYWGTSPGVGCTIGAPCPCNVMRVGLGGGTPVTLASEQPFLGGLAVDGTNVYWVTQGHFPGGPGGSPAAEAAIQDGTVMKIAVGGGEPTTLASGQGAPCGIAVDAESVYWTNVVTCGGDAGETSSCDGALMKIPLGGGTPTTLASGLHTPCSLGLDADDVYWSATESHAVLKVPLGGGLPVTLARVEAYPGLLAVDPAGVYFTNDDGLIGTVMRLAPK